MGLFGANKAPTNFALERAARIRSINYGSPEMVTIPHLLTNDVASGNLKSDADIDEIESALLDCDPETRQFIGEQLPRFLDSERQLGLSKRRAWERWTVLVDRLSVKA